VIRAVVDANVFVSGVLGYRHGPGAASEVMCLWRRGAFRAVASAPLIDEILRTIYESYFFDRIPQNDRIELLHALFTDVEQFEVAPSPERVASHPEDDLILATAVAGHADVLVTGDKQLLLLQEHQGADSHRASVSRHDCDRRIGQALALAGSSTSEYSLISYNFHD
jgi:putative PIN family toxin of toxin-antitoxin system